MFSVSSCMRLRVVAALLCAAVTAAAATEPKIIWNGVWPKFEFPEGGPQPSPPPPPSESATLSLCFLCLFLSLSLCLFVCLCPVKADRDAFSDCTCCSDVNSGFDFGVVLSLYRVAESLSGNVFFFAFQPSCTLFGQIPAETSFHRVILRHHRHQQHLQSVQ